MYMYIGRLTSKQFECSMIAALVKTLAENIASSDLEVDGQLLLHLNTGTCVPAQVRMYMYMT